MPPDKGFVRQKSRCLRDIAMASMPSLPVMVVSAFLAGKNLLVTRARPPHEQSGSAYKNETHVRKLKGVVVAF